jgi:hypothetical protein
MCDKTEFQSIVDKRIKQLSELMDLKQKIDEIKRTTLDLNKEIDKNIR